MTVTAEDLDAAVSHTVATLRQATDRDWLASPGIGEWSSWYTVAHAADCLVGYAAQLAAQPRERYVRFLATADDEATPADLLEFLVAGGGMLGAVVRTAPPSARGYHPSGMSDPAGFAAMGCVETLVHGEDVARNLGLVLDPPRATCERVLARMFPVAAEELADTDPWTALLWATDRVQLAGRPAQTGWRWRGRPLDE
ncbi:DinB family protein [Tamaricihabitans halophyticus]|uniref:DinB family protein n=1 Tax=Tamaricihabitans halophyticus TaxID=1262583 RepID=A0A4R2RCD1_9PSEU|nr:DinB family protein [Tamaricihabitans halophyticus]TCP57085.1 DinB family protein [Tamaricihabitans halophyticus]